MTYVKKMIPDSIEEKWHNYRKSLKEAEMENIGNDDISEHIEMAGWGVEEAERRNKGPGASEFAPFLRSDYFETAMLAKYRAVGHRGSALETNVQQVLVPS